MTERMREDWHLDKKIHAGHLFSTFLIICTLAGQAYLFGQWTGELNNRMVQVERRLEGFADRGQRVDRVVTEQGEDIAVLVAQLAEQSRQMDRLYAQMETTNALLRDLLTRGGPTRP